MCGIAGFTHRNGVLVSSCIRRATHSLGHRGPDQQGIYESAHVSLGAVRLKIIDLLSGGQPLHRQDNDTIIVFNGEIYNYAEIREELQARGHHFVTRCDTEVVLHAFREWDIRCFSRLRGMFGLALWTESRKRLVLARDRLGTKRLYYYRAGADLYFASAFTSSFFESSRQLYGSERLSAGAFSFSLWRV